MSSLRQKSTSIGRLALPMIVVGSLLSACAPGPAPYPMVGAYYPPYRPPPPYPSAGTFAPPVEPQAIVPRPEPLQRPDAALPAPPTPTPAPAPEPAPVAPSPAPSPGPVAGTPTPDSPQATIDSRPPGTRCGWWEPCNLWE